jgi:hypothetical protein
MSAAAPTLDSDTRIGEEIDSPEICESEWCNEHCRKPPHEADYVALLPCPCGHQYSICQDRADAYAFQTRLACGCGGTVPVEGIVLWPLK